MEEPSPHSDSTESRSLDDGRKMIIALSCETGGESSLRADILISYAVIDDENGAKQGKFFLLNRGKKMLKSGKTFFRQLVRVARIRP
jgi:hypothetical protein